MLLAIRKQWQGGRGGAANLIQALIPERPGEVEAFTDDHWRRAELTGQALVELNPEERGAARTLPRSCRTAGAGSAAWWQRAACVYGSGLRLAIR